MGGCAVPIKANTCENQEPPLSLHLVDEMGDGIALD